MTKFQNELDALIFTFEAVGAEQVELNTWLDKLVEVAADTNKQHELIEQGFTVHFSDDDKYLLSRLSYVARCNTCFSTSKINSNELEIKYAA
jgi:hypothetical protein